MFLPRTERTEDCPAGHVSCTVAIVGNSDNTQGSVPDGKSSSSSSSYLTRKGPHRYIGIGMVAAMAFVVLVLWMYYAEYPRRHLARIFGRRSDHDASLENEGATADPKEKSGERGLGEEDSEADTKVVDPESVGGSGARRTRRSKRPRTTRSERERARDRMLQSQPKRVIKEVSGGVVTFTEVPRPRPVRTRDRYLQPPADWDFEHVHGVRFEARSPKRHPDKKPPSRPSS